MSSTNTVSNVTAGKPNVDGAVYYAPIGSAIPTDSTTALAAAYLAIGYISDAGVVNSTDIESTDIKAWGGDNVLNIEGGKTDTFKFTMIEATNVNVLAAVYGSDNVSGTLAAGITVTVDGDEHDENIWVIDQILRDNTTKRIVIPDAKVTAVGDITYADGEAVGYEVTLTCFPDSTGATHYEYIKAD